MMKLLEKKCQPLLPAAVWLMLMLLLLMMGMPARETKIVAAYLWPAAAALVGVMAFRLLKKPSVIGWTGVGMAVWFWVCTVANGDLYLNFNLRFVFAMWITYGLCLPLMSLVDESEREEWLSRFAWGYGLFMLAVAVLCVYAVWNDKTLMLPGMEGGIGISKSRLYVLTKHPNEIGCSLNISMLCWLLLMLRSKKPIAKLMCGLALLPQAFAIALTASRTSIAAAALVLGAGMMVGVMEILRKKTGWMRWAAGVCAFGLAAAGMIWLLNAAIPALMNEKDQLSASVISTAVAETAQETAKPRGSQFEQRDFTEGLGTFSLRTGIWKAGLQYIKDDPRTLLLGSTDGQVSRIPSRYLGRDVYHMHNSWLEMLLQTGVVGFLAYAFIIVRMLWAAAKQFFCLQKPAWQRMLACAPVIMLICTLMEIYPCVSGNVMDMMYMLLAGAVIALDKPLKKA